MTSVHPAPDPSRLRIAAGSTALAVVLWNVSFLGPLLFPLRMLVTFAHEAGHGLAAILTGGDFVRFEIYANGSGVAWTAGGWRWVVLPAGYVGAALSAAVLLVGAHRANRPRRVAGALAVVIGVIGLFFGWSSLLALVSGLLAAAGFGVLAWKGTTALTVLVMDVVAFLMGWSAVLDLMAVIRTPTGTASGGILNDAAAFGDHVNILGGRFWGAVWLLIVLLVLGWAVRSAFGPTISTWRRNRAVRGA